MEQTLQVVRRKYMVKGCFEVQKMILEIDQHFLAKFLSEMD